MEKNQSVAHTLPYDLTLLGDWSVLRERSAAVSVPTLVLGGEKSPAFLRMRWLPSPARCPTRGKCTCVAGP